MGQALFGGAITMSMQDGLGAGRLWYPYSYLIAALARRAAFLTSQTRLLGGAARAPARARLGYRV